MPASTPTHDRELAAIAAAAAAVAGLGDAAARRRVLSYMMARFLPESPGMSPAGPVAAPGGELSGVARLTPEGELRITCRDLKARSALDAAVRLATVAIYANQHLTGEPLSSRGGLTPLLKAWGLYDGNTRARLARDRGIVRDGDRLSLNPEGRRRAERVVGEIRSPGPGVKPGGTVPRWGAPPEPEERQPSAHGQDRPGPARLHQDFENWENFAHRCAVGMHAVDRQGIVLWANDTELAYLGYRPEEYLGHPIEAFHLDQDVIHDILRRLIEGETIVARPVRMRAKDGSARYAILSSNVYRRKGGEFGHTRCFTVPTDEATWKALKQQREKERAA